jgi:hypothetical protein
MTLPLTTKGDLLSFDGSNYGRFPVGADGTVLSANSSKTYGLEWIVPPASCISHPVVFVQRSTNFTARTFYQDVTWDVTLLETNSAVIEHSAVNTERILIKHTGYYYIFVNGNMELDATVAYTLFNRLRLNGASTILSSEQQGGILLDFGWETADYASMRGTLVSLAAGDYITCQYACNIDFMPLWCCETTMAIMAFQ